MIAIVDYGMGNLRSVQKALERVGGDAQIVQTAEAIRRADKVVLPGVGAFRDAIGHLRERGLVDPLIEAARSSRPFLGICLGLQLLMDISYEDGEYAGLGVIEGPCVRFDWSRLPVAPSHCSQSSGTRETESGRRGSAGADQLKIPHMGWNQIRWSRPCPLLEGINQGEYFYFVHSYYVDPIDPTLPRALCSYGYDFTAMIWRDNLFASQFHPEKSQAAGLKILANFAAL